MQLAVSPLRRYRGGSPTVHRRSPLKKASLVDNSEIAAKVGTYARNLASHWWQKKKLLPAQKSSPNQ
jgi:hypothetical protein